MQVYTIHHAPGLTIRESCPLGSTRRRSFSALQSMFRCYLCELERLLHCIIHCPPSLTYPYTQVYGYGAMVELIRSTGSSDHCMILYDSRHRAVKHHKLCYFQHTSKVLYLHNGFHFGIRLSVQLHVIVLNTYSFVWNHLEWNKYI